MADMASDQAQPQQQVQQSIRSPRIKQTARKCAPLKLCKAITKPTSAATQRIGPRIKPRSVARKCAPLKQCKVVHRGQGAMATQTGPRHAPEPVEDDRTYVVKTLTEWMPNGFHSYEGPGEAKTDSVHTSYMTANARAKAVFFKHNPWGVSREEVEDMDWEEDCDEDGLFTYSAYSEDSQMWQVSVQEVKSLSDVEEVSEHGAFSDHDNGMDEADCISADEVSSDNLSDWAW